MVTNLERAKIYATNVISGKIVACEETRLACQRFITDLENDKSIFSITTLPFINLLLTFSTIFSKLSKIAVIIKNITANIDKGIDIFLGIFLIEFNIRYCLFHINYSKLSIKYYNFFTHFIQEIKNDIDKNVFLYFKYLYLT